MSFAEKLLKIVGEDAVFFDEPMAKHTTFRVGGPAKFYAVPSNADEITQLVQTASEENIDYFLFGRGSNLLCGDLGYDGLMIEIGSRMDKITWDEGGIVTAQAGVALGRLAQRVLAHERAGFEFASGIPGSVGGAVAMNAGAYGGEIKDCLVSAKVLDDKGNVREISAEHLDLAYRSSKILSRGYIVLEATFHFAKGNKEEIESRMKELNAKRREKQPLEFASAGSTFKRPEGYFAGKLIEDAGLRGYTVGDAQVSTKHCGFVINRGKATAADVKQVIDDVTRIVKEKFSVSLEPEVKMVGKF